jgi:hypothetical protein
VLVSIVIEVLFQLLSLNSFICPDGHEPGYGVEVRGGT